jgi:hypothetical protein
MAVGGEGAKMKTALALIFCLFATGAVTAWFNTPGELYPYPGRYAYYQTNPGSVAAYEKLKQICANPKPDFIDTPWPSFMTLLEETHFVLDWFIGVFNEVDLCKTINSHLWWENNGRVIFEGSVLGGLATVVVGAAWLAWRLRRAAGEAVISGLASGVRVHRRAGSAFSAFKQRVQDRADRRS